MAFSRTALLDPDPFESHKRPVHDPPLLAHIGGGLGRPDGATLEIELHNMLVYQPGQFFVAHKDSDKTADMIGTPAATSARRRRMLLTGDRALRARIPHAAADVPDCGGLDLLVETFRKGR